MKANISDYALITILLIVNEKNKVHLFAFCFCTFTVAELNYNIYNKRKFAILKTFKKFGNTIQKV